MHNKKQRFVFFIQVSWQRMTSKQTYSSSENLTTGNIHGRSHLTKGCPGLMPKELVEWLSLQLQVALPTIPRDQLFDYLKAGPWTQVTSFPGSLQERS